MHLQHQEKKLAQHYITPTQSTHHPVRSFFPPLAFLLLTRVVLGPPFSFPSFSYLYAVAGVSKLIDPFVLGNRPAPAPSLFFLFLFCPRFPTAHLTSHLLKKALFPPCPSTRTSLSQPVVHYQPDIHTANKHNKTCLRNCYRPLRPPSLPEHRPSMSSSDQAAQSNGSHKPSRESTK